MSGTPKDRRLSFRNAATGRGSREESSCHACHAFVAFSTSAEHCQTNFPRKSLSSARRPVRLSVTASTGGRCSGLKRAVPPTYSNSQTRNIANTSENYSKFPQHFLESAKIVPTFLGTIQNTAKYFGIIQNTKTLFRTIQNTANTSCHQAKY